MRSIVSTLVVASLNPWGKWRVIGCLPALGQFGVPQSQAPSVTPNRARMGWPASTYASAAVFLMRERMASVRRKGFRMGVVLK
jgi:hypothetical protein